MQHKKLPESHRPFTDKYFMRTNEILKAEGLNPYVRAQVFIRKGPGIVGGMEEAIDIIRTYSNIEKNGGRIFAKKDGERYGPKEALMVIEGKVQDIVELETMYLGVISAETTKITDGIDIDLSKVRDNMRSVVDLAEGKPVLYFGARHWRYDMDEAIAKAAFEGGASAFATDIGAKIAGKVGIGTIPHALENVYASVYGYKNAVVEATKAFDRVIDRSVPRIALIDYANKEIIDSINVANALEGRLAGVRVDTCGENVAEGALREYNKKELRELTGKNIELTEKEKEYWFGNGVKVSGVYALRKALDEAGHEDVNILLSSGFGNAEKVKVFMDAEKKLERRIFDGLGVGGVFYSRMATMDIVALGDDIDHMEPMSKIGRVYMPNPNLERVEMNNYNFFRK